MKQTEHAEQVALINWSYLNSGKYPELDLLHAIPNGGKRSIGVARKLKAEGVKPGIPDLFLPVARGDFHGLYVEMKSARGKLSPVQKEVQRALREQGYCVLTCYDWSQASDSIIKYLGL